MYCNKCGKEVSGDSKFCNFCGEEQKLIEDTSNKVKINNYNKTSVDVSCEGRSISKLSCRLRTSLHSVELLVLILLIKAFHLRKIYRLLMMENCLYLERVM